MPALLQNEADHEPTEWEVVWKNNEELGMVSECKCGMKNCSWYAEARRVDIPARVNHS